MRVLVNRFISSKPTVYRIKRIVQTGKLKLFLAKPVSLFANAVWTKYRSAKYRECAQSNTCSIACTRFSSSFRFGFISRADVRYTALSLFRKNELVRRNRRIRGRDHSQWCEPRLRIVWAEKRAPWNCGFHLFERHSRDRLSKVKTKGRFARSGVPRFLERYSDLLSKCIFLYVFVLRVELLTNIYNLLREIY